jgi:hypothetical protein
VLALLNCFIHSWRQLRLNSANCSSRGQHWKQKSMRGLHA